MPSGTEARAPKAPLALRLGPVPHALPELRGVGNLRLGGRSDVAIDVDDQHLISEIDLAPVDLSQTSQGLVVEEQSIGLREDLRADHDPTRQRLRAARIDERVAESS